MIGPAVHATRRAALMEHVDGPVLLVGNGHRPRNLPMSPVPFRRDSTFLFFTGCTTPGAALLLLDGVGTLFLPEAADDDALWHGHVVPIEDQGRTLGFDGHAQGGVRTIADLEAQCAPHRGRLHSIAVPDLGATTMASRLSGIALDFAGMDVEGRAGSDPLIAAIIDLRRTLSEDELDEMRVTARVTDAAHRAAMAATRPGEHEARIAALFNGVISAAGLVTAYPSIVTVDGEVLHNFHHVNTLVDGRLLLLDGGAEARSGYATDVTRTWPVSGRFNPRQRAAYAAVLEAQEAAIAKVHAGVRYREVHDTASLVLARFLADEGLISCSPEDAVSCGVHALFFPHGVGHLIGLDVHDLENFGDRAAYAPGRTRSTQFGTCYLRLDLDLEPGMVVTVEPGFYVVPAILEDPTLSERFRGQLNRDRLAPWLGFGGIRIEDDVAVTHREPEVLTSMIPSSIAAIEELVGTGPLAFA